MMFDSSSSMIDVTVDPAGAFKALLGRFDALESRGKLGLNIPAGFTAKKSADERRQSWLIVADEKSVRGGVYLLPSGWVGDTSYGKVTGKDSAQEAADFIFPLMKKQSDDLKKAKNFDWKANIPVEMNKGKFFDAMAIVDKWLLAIEQYDDWTTKSKFDFVVRSFKSFAAAQNSIAELMALDSLINNGNNPTSRKLFDLYTDNAIALSRKNQSQGTSALMKWSGFSEGEIKAYNDEQAQLKAVAAEQRALQHKKDNVRNHYNSLRQDSKDFLVKAVVTDGFEVSEKKVGIAKKIVFGNATHHLPARQDAEFKRIFWFLTEGFKVYGSARAALEAVGAIPTTKDQFDGLAMDSAEDPVAQMKALLARFDAVESLAVDSENAKWIDFFENMAKGAQSPEALVKEIRTVKNVPLSASEAFRAKYDPNGVLSILKTVTKMYEAVRETTNDTRIDPNDNSPIDPNYDPVATFNPDSEQGKLSLAIEAQRRNRKHFASAKGKVLQNRTELTGQYILSPQKAKASQTKIAAMYADEIAAIQRKYGDYAIQLGYAKNLMKAGTAAENSYVLVIGLDWLNLDSVLDADEQQTIIDDLAETNDIGYYFDYSVDQVDPNGEGDELTNFNGNLDAISSFFAVPSEQDAQTVMEMFMRWFGMERNTLERSANGTLFDSALDSGAMGNTELGAIYSIPVDLINTDPKAYQWRTDVDENGLDGRDLDDFDQAEQAPILLHEREDGRMYVVDGHHRLAMAEYSGMDEINARIVREDDGYSVEDAKLLGQMLNHADLVGKAVGLMQ